MSKVYMCTGSCHGQANQPGNCGAAACERYEKPLTEMNKCDKCATIYDLTEEHHCA